MRRNVKAALLLPAFLPLLAAGCRVEEVPPEPEVDEEMNGAAVETPLEAGEVPPVSPASPPDPARAEEPERIDPVPLEAEALLEVEGRFWVGEATRGAELSGTFVTHEAMLASLALDAPVVLHRERAWILADILVGVEFGGPGARATWWVAGPPEVIEAYLDRLEGDVDMRGALDELGILPLEVRHCCGEEAELNLSS